jgi:hypothetical protein
MIQAIIYDKTPNTQMGQMGGEMRVVGHQYVIPGSSPDKKGEWPTLETIAEDKHRDQKIIVMSYSDGTQQTIPDRGVEKILKIV